MKILAGTRCSPGMKNVGRSDVLNQCQRAINSIWKCLWLVRCPSLPSPLFTSAEMYTGIAQAQHTLHVLSIKTLCTWWPQTDVDNNRHPYCLFCLLSHIYIIYFFFFPCLSSGVLWACKDIVAGWRGPGMLRKIQRVSANWLCTIVSNWTSQWHDFSTELNLFFPFLSHSLADKTYFLWFRKFLFSLIWTVTSQLHVISLCDLVKLLDNTELWGRPELWWMSLIFHYLVGGGIIGVLRVSQMIFIFLISDYLTLEQWLDKPVELHLNVCGFYGSRLVKIDLKPGIFSSLYKWGCMNVLMRSLRLTCIGQQSQHSYCM